MTLSGTVSISLLALGKGRSHSVFHRTYGREGEEQKAREKVFGLCSSREEGDMVVGFMQEERKWVRGFQKGGIGGKEDKEGVRK